MLSSTDELSTAISYYQLFRSLQRQEEDKPQTQQAWAEDRWTDDDTFRAESMLEQNKAKCRVKSTLVQRYEKETAKSWNRFYQRHQTNFFKDRHYLPKDFPDDFNEEIPKTLVEIGCGVGNCILPLYEHFPKWTIWGFDLSKVGVDLMMQDERFTAAGDRAGAGVWDISNADEANPASGVSDITTLLFCLSAISPSKMMTACKNVMQTLKPGGILIFRDYGRYDEAQLKLGSSRAKLLAENFYVKSDGTRCYYFDLDDVKRLFTGLEILELSYLRRVYENRLEQGQRRRVWVQGRFRKPEK